MVAAFLVGCQATPEENVVVKKDLEQMLALAMSPQERQGSLSEVLGVSSDYYKIYLENVAGNVQVTVDAHVVLPDADSIPLIRIQKAEFSSDMVDQIIGLLLSDGPLYEPESLTELTKSDIEERLTKLKLKKAELEAQGMTPLNPYESDPAENDSSSTDEVMVSTLSQLDEVNEAIRIYEDMLNTAPDEREYIEITRESLEESSLIRVAQPNPDSGIVSFMANSGHIEYVNRADDNRSNGLYYSEKEWEDAAEEGDKADAEELEFPSITERQAQAITDRFLAEIGVDYMACTLAEKVIGGSSNYYAADIRNGNLVKGYRLQYVRKVAGVPVTYTNVEATWDMENSEAAPWSYERLTFIVDDRGIVEMQWDAPYNLTETVTETTNMLPFSKIQDVFEKMIVISQNPQRATDLTITEVRLGLGRITAQNDLDNGLLIPVWDFFGTATYHYQDGDMHSHTVADPGASYLTINAIDGSIIDRSLGY